MTNFVNLKAESAEHAIAVAISELFPASATVTYGSVHGFPAISVFWLVDRIGTVEDHWNLHIVFDDELAKNELSRVEYEELRIKPVKQKVFEYLETLDKRRQSEEGIGPEFFLYLTRPVAFEIADVSDVTTGDHISFIIKDRDGQVPARISGTALAVLSGNEIHASRLDVFNAHIDRIRHAAYKSRRSNPTLAMILLGAADFGG
ncbi:hypothetical protein SAMN05445504_2424 [Burkholderia sp. CF099]|nr:hypothetical protein SAMN05445504_2424 [Burkholderia sp. CF099]